MKRTIYLDWLRILAALAVVTIHVAAGVVTDKAQTYESPWMAGNFFESISRWAVPMFVMISGALMLSSKKEISTSNFLETKMAKILIPLFAFSVIYYANEVRKGEFTFSISDFIERFATDDIMYHLWFLYMIAGLYLITPLLKILIQHAKRKDVEYFLLLWLFASVISKALEYFIGYSFKIELFFVTHYVGYFVLGYYLYTYDLQEKWRNLLYFGGFVGWITTFFMTYHESVKLDEPLEHYWYDEHSPNVLLVAVALFVLFKSTKLGEAKLPWIGTVISQASFGIYLIHVLVMQTLYEKFEFVWFDLHPIIGIPYKILIVTALSTILVSLVRKVPIVRGIIP
ncbi:acyltransferase [Sporosarcina gallistercoris]|uniref:Acyltransferase family protein n=1 Tax=Sporosarcina gallistercoris TaxID=2762245 RepID=A0ABR8PMJ3_9BACL|nr:acyltransferase family protein [Sporosarcina gallistercoris]MBD7909405.1 acyltransferase family protein [Sporosarcina gallistercoris]